MGALAAVMARHIHTGTTHTAPFVLVGWTAKGMETRHQFSSLAEAVARVAKEAGRGSHRPRDHWWVGAAIQAQAWAWPAGQPGEPEGYPWPCWMFEGGRWLSPAETQGEIERHGAASWCVPGDVCQMDTLTPI